MRTPFTICLPSLPWRCAVQCKQRVCKQTVNIQWNLWLKNCDTHHNSQSAWIFMEYHLGRLTVIFHLGCLRFQFVPSPWKGKSAFYSPLVELQQNTHVICVDNFTFYQLTSTSTRNMRCVWCGKFYFSSIDFREHLKTPYHFNFWQKQCKIVIF